MRFILVSCFLMVFSCRAWPGEKLIYCIIHKGSGFVAEYTEIMAVDPVTSARKAIFSDRKIPVVLREQLYAFHFPAAGGNKMFAHASERNKLLPLPGNGSIYELRGDPASSVREISQVLGSASLGDIFADSAGMRIAYVNDLNRKKYLFIHDAFSGKLLQQKDVTDIFLDCFASSIGWMPHSEKIYFTLETGDEHVTSDASYERVGAYVMDSKDGRCRRIDLAPNLEGYGPPQNVRIIGVLPGGEYILEAMMPRENKTRGASETKMGLIKLNTATRHSEDISFGPACPLYTGIRVNYQISNSGRYLAAAKLPISSSAVAWDIWLKDLQTGEDKLLLSVPVKGLEGPFPGLVGWVTD